MWVRLAQPDYRVDEIVVGLGFGWQDASDRRQQSVVVEPRDPLL